MSLLDRLRALVRSAAAEPDARAREVPDGPVSALLVTVARFRTRQEAERCIALLESSDVGAFLLTQASAQRQGDVQVLDEDEEAALDVLLDHHTPPAGISEDQGCPSCGIALIEPAASPGMTWRCIHCAEQWCD